MYSMQYSNKLDCDDQKARHYLISGIVSDLPPEAAILDVGCGTGTTYEAIRRLGVNYHGIDISPQAISIASRTFEGDTSSFEVSDFTALQTTSKYDLILFSEVFYYFSIEDLGPAIERALSLLKDADSVLLISMSENAKAAKVWEQLESLPKPFQNIALQSDVVGSKWRVKAYMPLKNTIPNTSRPPRAVPSRRFEHA